MKEESIEKCKTFRLGRGRFRIELNPVVTLLSIGLIWGLVIYCIVEPEKSLDTFIPINTWITKAWTWLYIGKMICVTV